MSTITDHCLPFSSIIGLSPLNPRQDEPSDVTSLAATIRARGLLHPILVHTVPNRPGYFVLAGGRRWRALRLLDQPGEEDIPIQVRLFEGSDAEAREAALAEAVTQKPLHPVEEFEAFSALEKSGFDIPTIAHDFALTERHVRQRLALGNLSPRVLNLWRDGAIDREQANAFTAAGTEAQEALLDSATWGAAGSGMRAYAIRQSLLADALDANDSDEARFLLNNAAALEHYRAAGGRLDEELFTGAIFRDGALARESIAAVCRGEANRLCAEEGWGGALVCFDGYHPSAVAPDFTVKEQNWLAANEAEIDKAYAQAGDARAAGDAAAADDMDAQVEALEAARESVETKALLRAVSKNARKDLCVYVDSRSNGRFEIVRAVRRPAPVDAMTRRPQDADDDEGADERTPTKPREHKEPEPPPLPPAYNGKDADAIIADAIGEALTRATARSLNLALALAVAALGCSHGRVGVGLSLEPGPGAAPGKRSELFERIEHQRFETAIAIVAGAPLCDLSVAFAEIVGDAIDYPAAPPSARSNILQLASGLCDLSADLCEALDYKALFESLPREEALAAIRAIDGEAAAVEAAKLRKPKLIERAALLAKDRRWLPESLATLKASAPKDERSRAEAMLDAIEDDEAQSPATKPAPPPSASPRQRAAPKKAPAKKTQAKRGATKPSRMFKRVQSQDA
jgi:ParB family transcriptional regulator, chromosome partitioning protein